MNQLNNKYRIYLGQLEKLRKNIVEDFEYYRNQNSIIDRRLNELGRRGNIEENGKEMAELLSQREIVKDRSMKLLPLYDLFKNGYDEVLHRVERFESNSPET
ncbi:MULTISPECIES: hypothetical protein [unclassified Oceanobacillus]|uniref:hypothetical protein n=1 Tax=unclassified Oceanobacillus TaxID=2630292 RepID=UPI00300E48A6